MAKFMLARGKRAGSYDGVKVVKADGGIAKVIEYVGVMFRPGRAVDVPDEVSMDGWVENGTLIPIRERAAVAVPTPPVEPDPVPPVEPDPAPMVEPDPAPPVEPEEEPEVEEEEEEEEEDADYEEMEDGGYKCLHCGKIYKPSSRAKEFIENHVADKHSDE